MILVHAEAARNIRIATEPRYTLKTTPKSPEGDFEKCKERGLGMTPKSPKGDFEKCKERRLNMTPKSPEGDFEKCKERRLGMKNMFYGAPQILFEFAKELRNNQTETEVFLWNYISKNQIEGARFKRQHPILYFIADFYCHKAKLIIEINGIYHQLPEQHQYDIERDGELNCLGLKVLRFTNKEILFETEKGLEIIRTEVKNRLQ